MRWYFVIFFAGSNNADQVANSKFATICKWAIVESMLTVQYNPWNFQNADALPPLHSLPQPSAMLKNRDLWHRRVRESKWVHLRASDRKVLLVALYVNEPILTVSVIPNLKKMQCTQTANECSYTNELLTSLELATRAKIFCFQQPLYKYGSEQMNIYIYI